MVELGQKQKKIEGSQLEYHYFWIMCLCMLVCQLSIFQGPATEASLKDVLDTVSKKACISGYVCDCVCVCFGHGYCWLWCHMCCLSCAMYCWLCVIKVKVWAAHILSAEDERKWLRIMLHLIIVHFVLYCVDTVFHNWLWGSLPRGWICSMVVPTSCSQELQLIHLLPGNSSSMVEGLGEAALLLLISWCKRCSSAAAKVVCLFWVLLLLML